MVQGDLTLTVQGAAEWGQEIGRENPAAAIIYLGAYSWVDTHILKADGSWTSVDCECEPKSIVRVRHRVWTVTKSLALL